MTKRRNFEPTLETIAQNAVIDYGFTPFFNQAVEQRLKQIKVPAINKKDGVRDLRDLFWSSLDNIDSQDLDQLEYCELRKQGVIHVKIAIADVDYYVTRGDAIDRHASHNATSLYTGIHNFPMLPEQLSYHLSSLLPGQDRLAIVVQYNIKKDGQIDFGDVYRAWVCNKAKLVYEEAAEWFEKPKSKYFDWLNKDVEEQLLLQLEAAKRLRNRRRVEGMLEFETFEPKPVIDNGQVKDLQDRRATSAHKIIEQFMIAANQSLVQFLTKHNIPTIQRIVRNPDRWGKIVEIANEYGYSLPSEPNSKALSEFLMIRLKKSKDTFEDFSLMIIKLIGRGEYEMVSPGKYGHGHFGIAVNHYTHSTAPNRRYVDLVIQRLVKAVLDNKPIPYTKRELIEVAAWCTERDTASKKLERFMRKVASAILLQSKVGQTFEGIITGASEKGVFVRVLKPPAEGRIMRGERGLDVGDHVMVRLTAADLMLGHLDFQRV